MIIVMTIIIICVPIIIMMRIIIICVRCNDHHLHDNHHDLCTTRWSPWWQSSSFVYDAMIIICVWCDDHHPCTMRWISWWRSPSFVYDVIIIMMTIIIICVRCNHYSVFRSFVCLSPFLTCIVHSYIHTCTMLSSSHGLTARRAQRTKSSRPEGPHTRSWGPLNF